MRTVFKFWTVAVCMQIVITSGIVISAREVANNNHSIPDVPEINWVNTSTGLSLDEFWVAEFGDFNKDGNLDLAAGSGNYSGAPGNGVRVWWGDGAGGWTDKVGPITTGVYSGLACKDIDGDGIDDIVCSSMNYSFFSEKTPTPSTAISNGIRAWKSMGDGTWTVRDTGLPTTGNYYRLTLVNVTGDDNLDIVVGSEKNGVEVYQGNDLGSWTLLTSTGLPQDIKVFCISVNDVNKDGIMDIGWGASSGDLGVYIGDGIGHWSNSSTGLPSGEYLSISSILLDDLDGDGNVDVLGGSYMTKGLRFWKGDGTGTWTDTTTTLPSKNEYYDIKFADVTNDGKKDLLAVKAGYIFAKPPQLEIYAGNGAGGWSAPQNITISVIGYSVNVGDFDNNGALDLVTTAEVGVCCWTNEITVFEIHMPPVLAFVTVSALVVIFLRFSKSYKTHNKRI